MLSGLAEGAIEFQGLEMDVFFGHEVDELINAEAVFFGTCQLEDYLSLVISDIISIFSDYLLHFACPDLAILRECFKIAIKVPPLSVVLDECLFEFVEFEHVDILSFELCCQVTDLFVEIVGIIQRLGCALQFPLGLTACLLGLAVPSQTLLLKMRALVWIFGLGLLLLILDKRVGGLVVARLRFYIALLEHALGLIAQSIKISVGSTHKVYSGCTKFHYNKFILQWA